MNLRDTNDNTPDFCLPYFPPNPGEISIVAITPYLGMNEIIRSQVELINILKELADCGFNLFHTNFNERGRKEKENKYQKLQDLLQATYGIKTITSNQLKILFGTGRFNSIHAEDIVGWLDNFVGIYKVCQIVKDTDGKEECKEIKYQDSYQKERAIALFGGISQVDEPDYYQLTEFSTLYHCYKFIYSSLFDHYKYLNNLIYNNLAGGVISDKQYMKLYNKNFTPSFYSYDAYPIRKVQWGVYLDTVYFYNDLEFFSSRYGRSTLKEPLKRIPFWAFYLGTGYTLQNLSEFHPAPTEPYLRIAAFSALGYGAKGISCWVYHQRPNTEEIYFGAPIDLEDNKTAAWYYVKKINKEISKYNDVFLRLNL